VNHTPFTQFAGHAPSKDLSHTMQVLRSIGLIKVHAGHSRFPASSILRAFNRDEMWTPTDWGNGEMGSTDGEMSLDCCSLYVG
jgi:hypothetical protein